MDVERSNHFDERGNAVMVDVSGKNATLRVATASGKIQMNEAAFRAVRQDGVAKGDVLGVARVAGIMAVKRTAELIPLCHTLMIQKVSVKFAPLEEERAVRVECTVKTTGKTGVEMEALTGASVALLTVYDMCKALDKGMEVTDIRLEEKSGGKSGLYQRGE